METVLFLQPICFLYFELASLTCIKMSFENWTFCLISLWIGFSFAWMLTDRQGKISLIMSISRRRQLSVEDTSFSLWLFSFKTELGVYASPRDGGCASTSFVSRMVRIIDYKNVSMSLIIDFLVRLFSSLEADCVCHCLETCVSTWFVPVLILWSSLHCMGDIGDFRILYQDRRNVSTWFVPVLILWSSLHCMGDIGDFRILYQDRRKGEQWGANASESEIVWMCKCIVCNTKTVYGVIIRQQIGRKLLLAK